LLARLKAVGFDGAPQVLAADASLSVATTLEELVEPRARSAHDGIGIAAGRRR
jgi:hypothetical protein